MTLYNTENPIDRGQRKNINDTWQDILKRFADLQTQINFLSGEEVEEILTRINEAVNNANTAATNAQEAVADANAAIAQLQTALNNATKATTAANKAAQDGTALNNQLTALKGELEKLKLDLDAIVAAEQGRVTAEQGRTTAETGRANAEKARATAETGRDNAEKARDAAEKLRVTAETAREATHDQVKLLLGNLKSVDYVATETYNFPTIVSHDGSSYIVLKDGIQAIPPSDDKVNYRLIARKGADGASGTGTADLTAHMEQNGHILYGADTGTTPNAKIVTLNPAPAAITDGFALTFKNNLANTAATTINVNGKGALPIVKSNGAGLTNNYLKAGGVYTLRCVNNIFYVQGEAEVTTTVTGGGTGGGGTVTSVNNVQPVSGNVTLTADNFTDVAKKSDITGLTTALDDKLDKAGGTMTGTLLVNADITAGTATDQIKMRYDADLDEGQIIALKPGVEHIPVTIVGRGFKYRPSINNVNLVAYDVITTEKIMYGNGSPEGVVVAPVGSLYLNNVGGVNITLYVKETGTGNTGWIAK